MEKEEFGLVDLIKISATNDSTNELNQPKWLSELLVSSIVFWGSIRSAQTIDFFICIFLL